MELVTDSKGVLRILPGDTAHQDLVNTTSATYQVAVLSGAHDADMGFSQSMLDAKQMANDLLRLSQIEDPDHGTHVRVSSILACAAATALLADLDPDYQDAADEWQGLYKEINATTKQSAISAVTHPQREVPDDPWDEDA